jgi:hypothetical protein
MAVKKVTPNHLVPRGAAQRPRKPAPSLSTGTLSRRRGRRSCCPIGSGSSSRRPFAGSLSMRSWLGSTKPNTRLSVTMARKRRRKPLKSLKTDSLTASRRLATVKGPPLAILAGPIHGDREAQLRWPARRAPPGRPSPSARWSRGGAPTRCFRLLPCVRER